MLHLDNHVHRCNILTNNCTKLVTLAIKAVVGKSKIV